jgi:hypothetical protein
MNNNKLSLSRDLSHLLLFLLILQNYKLLLIITGIFTFTEAYIILNNRIRFKIDYMCACVCVCVCVCAISMQILTYLQSTSFIFETLPSVG